MPLDRVDARKSYSILLSIMNFADPNTINPLRCFGLQPRVETVDESLWDADPNTIDPLRYFDLQRRVKTVDESL